MIGEAKKAVDLQNTLVEKAAGDDEKRDRTIALALVYEQAATVLASASNTRAPLPGADLA